ncbi:putative chromatin regulator PHD family [Arabidopsis thaliana]|uniref:MEE53 n=2 Tax=Arabidopsis TaxID=3701 RepID=A0A178V3X6_ARATH|nr:DC1 [Arabidopsis thaliana x Arabidopsis arenosa]OAP00909.1 MEE53 [Arabidopsis thaliana]
MDSELELISLISQLISLPKILDSKWNSVTHSEIISLIAQIISLVSSMDLHSQPKPESEFMSLVTQAISLFDSMDLDPELTPLSELISLLSQIISTDSDSDSNRKVEWDLDRPLCETLFGQPEPELVSLIYQIFSLVSSINSKSEKFISLCPQLLVELEKGNFHVSEYFQPWGKWYCLPGNWVKFKFTGEDATYFGCKGCNGKNHEEYEQAPDEIKHHLHRKHSLQLVFFSEGKERKCYCCDDDLEKVIYCCVSCDYAMNMACAKKPPVLSIDHPKWHEHTLVLFPRRAFLTCNLCGLADARSPLYMCPPCDFVVHLRCIDLPRVIRISRHHHRISFTPSFDQERLSCGVCQKNIDNDYGGYSCIKEGCLYAAHSKCATQRNVWDGKELEGEQEEEIKEVEPFVKISDGIIQHFSHQHHHLRLDDNINRDYDENKECQACIRPIYFGNFYSCMQCEFILHEECANLFRQIYHPIHPHMLSLGYDNIVDHEVMCAAYPSLWTAGFFYECGKEGCDFKLPVQFATTSEPLVHESHMHPLFLTSKPEEDPRRCSVCKESRYARTNETFNCIECDFALCFVCATLPQKVRYKHDKHVLTLFYGNETSTITYWCEICEGTIDPTKRFYVCDEYCCLTLHIKCLLGWDLYMKHGSSSFYLEKKVDVLSNNHHMTRPICCYCEKRCPYKICLEWSGSIYCSSDCIFTFLIF